MSQFAKDLVELMAKYDTARAAWIDANGSDDGFDSWVAAKLGMPA